MSEYSGAVVFHFEKTVEKPQDRKPWSKDTIKRLIELERQVFLSGYYKTILIHNDGRQSRTGDSEISLDHRVIIAATMKDGNAGQNYYKKGRLLHLSQNKDSAEHHTS